MLQLFLYINIQQNLSWFPILGTPSSGEKNNVQKIGLLLDQAKIKVIFFFRNQTIHDTLNMEKIVRPQMCV